VDSTLRVVMSVHVGLCAMTVFQWGTEEQKRKFLVPLARGEKIGCGAFTEPGAGSDFANIHTTGKRDGNDFILNGEKMWISLASLADYALVTVRTIKETDKPSSGLTAFIVDLNSPGVTRDDIHGKLGVRAGSTGWINFQDVRVPAANMIGEEGEGFKVTMSAFDSGRYTVAAGATGIIRASLEASVAYAKERVQFDQHIADFQGLKWFFAEMQTDYEAAWLLTYRAALMKDLNLPCKKEASMCPCSNRAMTCLSCE